MLVTLLVVETTDILFMMDSNPAILGITTNPFIVFETPTPSHPRPEVDIFALAHIMSAFCYLMRARRHPQFHRRQDAGRRDLPCRWWYRSLSSS